MAQRVLMVVATLLLGQAIVLGEGNEAAKVPGWIAVRNPSVAQLSLEFQLQAIQSANLRFAGDFCRTQIAVNGRPVADVLPYSQTLNLNVTDALRPGKNDLRLTVESTSNENAAIAASLTVRQADGRTVTIVSDEKWMAISNAGETMSVTLCGRVAPELWGVDRRDISIDPFENYEQWQQAKGGGGTAPRFFVATGFEIAQLRVAGPDEGSWISMAFDDTARLLIGREDHGFLRMTIADDGKSVSKVQSIDSDLLECRGLVFHGGRLFASANNSKTLFRVRLSDSGQIVEQTALREFAGGVGHGRNDLALSNKSLYWIFGDSVDPPQMNILDHTSPLRKAVAGKLNREGSLLRTTLDGTSWELLCAGMRNPYGIDVHPSTGDPFTYDADNEYDLGMPWYRPTRILQLMPGGDYGYREASGQLPPRFSDQADNAPPLIDIGRGSPTSVICGSAFRFPPPYRDALFVLDWTYGRVMAVHLAERGATYRAATELFLQGRPLNVTDVAAGPDGAMYLITGGRKTQSALYRIAAVASSTKDGGLGPDVVSLTRQTEIRESARMRRDLVRSLQFQADDARLGLKNIFELLQDSDPIVRYSARTNLEKRPVSEWLDDAIEYDSVYGLLAAARTLDASNVSKIVDRLLTTNIRDRAIDERLVWLRILDLCLQANPDIVHDKRVALEGQVLKGWESCLSPEQQYSVEGTNADYRRRSALLLDKLDCLQLPSIVARDLLASEDQADQITGLMALRNRRSGWSRVTRELQLQVLASMSAMVGGEGLPNFHAWLERDTLATLTEEEKALYAKLKSKQIQPEPLPAARPLIKRWMVEDLDALVRKHESGDAVRGKAIFRDALCGRCHRFGSTGPWVGPDLTQVAGRFSRRDLLDSMINPSKSVAENYRQVIVETDEGKVVTGRPLAGGDFRSEVLRLIPDLLRPDQTIELNKKSIESHRFSEVSPMPQNLLDSFSQDEIADLLAYLTHGAPTNRGQ